MCVRSPCAPHLLPYRAGFGLWGERCDHVDEQGIERGYRMQVWLICSGGATLLFIALLVGMMFQSFLATVGFASAAASARDVRSELENGTATHETVSRHTYRAWISDALSQVTGTALSVTMVFCYIPLTVFSTVWFILGNYWFWWLVRENTCNQVVYNVCWWTIVYTYAMLLLGCVAGPGLDPAHDNGETKREAPTQHNTISTHMRGRGAERGRSVGRWRGRASGRTRQRTNHDAFSSKHYCQYSYKYSTRILNLFHRRLSDSKGKEKEGKGASPFLFCFSFLFWANRTADSPASGVAHTTDVVARERRHAHSQARGA